MIKKHLLGVRISVVLVVVLMTTVLHYSGYTISDFIGETASAEIEEFFDENGIFLGSNIYNNSMIFLRISNIFKFCNIPL